MQVILIVGEDSGPPFVHFGGVVETPEGVTHEDMNRLYVEWHMEWQKSGGTGEEFIEWLIRTQNCTEVQMAYAIVGVNSIKEAREMSL